MLPPAEPGAAATQVVSVARDIKNNMYLALLERDAGSDWQISSSVFLFITERVPFKGWDGSVGDAGMVVVDDVVLVGINYPNRT